MIKPAMLTGAIVLALAGRVGYHLYQQSQQEVATIGQRLHEAQHTQELREALAGVLTTDEQLRRQLSPAPDAEWLVREVSRLADEAGVPLSAMIHQPPQRLQELTHVAVTLQFSASYHDTARLVSALEHSPTFLRIDELSVTGSRLPTDHPRIRMTVSTLYAPPITQESGHAG